MNANTWTRNAMEDTGRNRPRSVVSILRRTERSERSRVRKETFQRRWKEEREQLISENQRLRRENESSLRLLLRMTRRFEKLRSYTETLRTWIATRPASGRPMNRSESDDVG